MRWFFRRFWLPFYRRWALYYVRRSRRFRLQKLRLQVPSGVFHPGLYFSTPIFARFLQRVDFNGKTVLDVGTGSGALALLAAQSGAQAFALDIHPLAVETARRNAEENSLLLQVWQSDLFESLPPQSFDYLLVNPPYYPRTPQNLAEHAFFAGVELDYFKRLFVRMPERVRPGGKAWMILSEDCDLAKIGEIAAESRLKLAIVHRRKKWGEQFFVFEITLESEA